MLGKLLAKASLPEDMNLDTTRGRNLTMLVVNVVNALGRDIVGFSHPLTELIRSPKSCEVC